MNVSELTVEGKIKEIISSIAVCDITHVNNESNLIRDLGMDSTDILDLLFSLEEEFPNLWEKDLGYLGILNEIYPGGSISQMTVGPIINYVQRNVGVE